MDWMVGWLARKGTPRWGTLLKLNSNSKGRAAGETGSGNKGELRTKVNEQNVGNLKKERALKQRRRVRTEYDFGPWGAILCLRRRRRTLRRWSSYLARVILLRRSAEGWRDAKLPPERATKQTIQLCRSPRCPVGTLLSLFSAAGSFLDKK